LSSRQWNCDADEVQLRALSAAIEDALQRVLQDPDSLAALLLEIASQEIYQQLQIRRGEVRAAA
jgi:hypothetical protein